MSKSTIKDTRIRLRPSQSLLQLLNEHKDAITELPENISKALKMNGYSPASKVEILTADFAVKPPLIDTKLLADLCSKAEQKQQHTQSAAGQKNNADNSEEEEENKEATVYLNLQDLRWLNVLLTKLRTEQGVDVFLHNVIESCRLELPQNEVVPRDPVLEARCQKLREEQQNREYRKMTKNVDASLKNFPEDTIAYQMKSINSQLVAVLQFVVSVIAGFVFGFLGIELIIGNLDFGFRLLLGIMCALIIALAEIYFLAKKLSEYDNVVSDVTGASATYPGTPMKKKKPHTD